jgi:N-methylhydantoinase B
MIRKNGKKELLPSKCDRVPVAEGDLLYFDTWGGGGWGDPFKRPAEAVAFDVDAGLVSREGAKRYGVVIKPNGTVDDKATTALRAKMTKKRGKTKLFDFGGTIPELKKACKKETGLEPPTQPVFQVWAKSGTTKPAAAGGAKKPRKVV